MSDVALRASLSEVHKQWFAGGLLLDAVASDCPSCDSSNYKLYWEKDDFRFSRCADCGFVWVNPQPSVEQLHSFYETDFIKLYNAGKFLDQPKEEARQISRDVDWLLSGVLQRFGRRRGTFVEVGPGGVGHFMETAFSEGFKITGIEIDPSLADQLAAKFGDDASIIVQAFGDGRFEGEAVDVVAMRDVLEHLPSPMAVIREVARILSPGGLFLITVPNVDGWIFRLVGSRHTTVFGFEHVNYWSERSLSYTLRRAGLAVEAVRHESRDFTLRHICEYLLGESTFTTVHPTRRGNFRKSLHVLLRIALRVLRPIDKRLTPLLSQWARRGSVIHVIASKPPDAELS